MSCRNTPLRYLSTSALMLPMYPYFCLRQSTWPRWMQNLGYTNPRPWPPNMISHTIAWTPLISRFLLPLCGVRSMWFVLHFLILGNIDLQNKRQFWSSGCWLHADLYGTDLPYEDKPVRYDISDRFVCPPTEKKFDIFFQVILMLRRDRCRYWKWMAGCGRPFFADAQLLGRCRSCLCKSGNWSPENAERKILHSLL